MRTHGRLIPPPSPSWFVLEVLPCPVLWLGVHLARGFLQACSGTGKVSDGGCPHCHGRRVTMETETFEVRRVYLKGAAGSRKIASGGVLPVGWNVLFQIQTRYVFSTTDEGWDK